MSKNNTYNPEDIESLLIHKKFEELHTQEKNFVMQHIDSEKEYKLMRATLLAIKKSADNDEALMPKKETKEELLLLMEKQNKKGFGWINLNGLWSFLFPTDVRFTRKPAFQFATVGLLVICGLYFSNNLLKNNNNNLAINEVADFNIEKEKAKEKHTLNRLDSTNLITGDENKTKSEIKSNKEPKINAELISDKEGEISNLKTAEEKTQTIIPNHVLDIKETDAAINFEDDFENEETITKNGDKKAKNRFKNINKNEAEKPGDGLFFKDIAATTEENERDIGGSGFLNNNNGYKKDKVLTKITKQKSYTNLDKINLNRAARNSPSKKSSSFDQDLKFETSDDEVERGEEIKNKSIESQSLSDDEEIISLLYITM